MHNQTESDNRIISLEEMVNTPIGTLAGYDAGVLYRLHKEASENSEQARHRKQWIEGAIDLKYRETVNYERLKLEKESGIIHISDNGHRISSEVKKKVIWEQKLLKELADYLMGKGEKLSRYIDISYNVPERKYKDFSKATKQLFNPARQVSLSTPVYSLTPIEEERL